MKVPQTKVSHISLHDTKRQIHQF